MKSLIFENDIVGLTTLCSTYLKRIKDGMKKNNESASANINSITNASVLGTGIYCISKYPKLEFSDIVIATITIINVTIRNESIIFSRIDVKLI